MSLSCLVNYIRDAERGEVASSSSQANFKQWKLNGPLAYAGVKQVAPTNQQSLRASSSARAGVSSSSPLPSMPHSTPGSSTPMGKRFPHQSLTKRQTTQPDQLFKASSKILISNSLNPSSHWSHSSTRSERRRQQTDGQ